MHTSLEPQSGGQGQRLIVAMYCVRRCNLLLPNRRYKRLEKQTSSYSVAGLESIENILDQGGAMPRLAEP